MAALPIALGEVFVPDTQVSVSVAWVLVPVIIIPMSWFDSR